MRAMTSKETARSQRADGVKARTDRWPDTEGQAAGSEKQQNPYLIPTRESLLSRLKETSADESWREFFETYWKLIYNNARRAGLSDNEAQDVVQETMVALMVHIRGFRV